MMLDPPKKIPAWLDLLPVYIIPLGLTIIMVAIALGMYFFPCQTCG